MSVASGVGARQVGDALSDERRALVDTVRLFGSREVAPAIAAADRESGGHLSREAYLRLYASAAGIGLPGLLIPEDFGGSGRGCLEHCLVQEEIGAVDAGFAASLALTMSVVEMVRVGGNGAQQDRLLRAVATGSDHILAGALNEPSVAGSDLFDPMPQASGGIRTRAERQGESYVLTGAKAGWVTNAGIAREYFVFARTSLDTPAPLSTSCFLVPADAPGLSVGARSELLGLRSGWHAELYLDAVRVPASARLGPEGGGLPLMQASTPGMPVALAAVFVGLARRAYDEALAWASTRQSWGRPIREHQAVALMLADMSMDLTAARLLVHAAARAVDGDPTAGDLPVLVPSAKARAVEVAIANAQRAVKVFGGSGVTVGLAPEKLLRDAWTGYSCDFTGDLLRLGVAAAL